METDIICCDIFTELLNSAGEKGFSIIPVSHQNTYKFFLQARSTGQKDVEKKGLSVVERAISYCPWCGCNLEHVVSKNRSKIADLAEKNQYLFIKLY